MAGDGFETPAASVSLMVSWKARATSCSAWGEHLPAPAQEDPIQGVRGGEHLPAPAQEEQMQGVRGGEHLPEPVPEEHMQRVRSANHRGWARR
jgi:hypothetical protein